MPKKRIILLSIVGVLCLCLAATAAMTGGMPKVAPAAPQAAVSVETPAPPLAATPSRCNPASEAQAAAIRAAVQDTQAGNDVDQLYQVKSKDFERVYMLAGQITGEGIDPGDAVGVWAVSGEPDKPGMILSVEGFAHQFSGFPLGSTTDAEADMTSDGAAEALACARAALK